MDLTLVSLNPKRPLWVHKYPKIGGRKHFWFQAFPNCITNSSNWLPTPEIQLALSQQSVLSWVSSWNAVFLRYILSVLQPTKATWYPSANTEAPSLALLPIHLQYLSWWLHLQFAYHPSTNEDSWVTTSVTSWCQAPSASIYLKTSPNAQCPYQAKHFSLLP